MKSEGIRLRHKNNSTESSKFQSTSSKSGQKLANKSRDSPLCYLVVKGLLLFIIAFIIFCSYLVLTPGPIEPRVYNLPNPPKLTGPLAINSRLTQTERIMEGIVFGPESIILENGKLYTGTYDGKVVEIENERVKSHISWGTPPCQGFETEPTCGRPLGVRMASKNHLLVADAYLGLFSVDTTTGNYTRLLAGGTLVQGKPLIFINDVEYVDQDLLIFTESSSKWDRRHFFHVSLEYAGDGRLLSFRPSTGELVVLVDHLLFPNGLQLSSDRRSILVAETIGAKIGRYHISGPKMGEYELFKQNLPGFPDNIRLASNGSLWVPLAGVRFEGKFSLFDFFGPRPWLRKLLARLIPDSQLPVLFHYFKPKHSMAVLLNDQAEYVASLHDPNGKIVPDMSQITDGGDVLYLGSFHSDFIGKLTI